MRLKVTVSNTSTMQAIESSENLREDVPENWVWSQLLIVKVLNTRIEEFADYYAFDILHQDVVDLFLLSIALRPCYIFAKFVIDRQ